MPIYMCKAGDALKVQRVTGNREIKQFLENLGFLPGVRISIISSIGGNVIVEVKESRIAVNKDMAKHIIV